MNRTNPTRTQPRTTRPSAAVRLGAALLVCALTAAFAEPAHGPHFQAHGGQAPHPQQAPAPIVRQAPPAQRPAQSGEHMQGQKFVDPTHPGQPQHLAQWMQSHRNLTLDQQQRALQAEPGFSRLQPDVQQRMHDRLTQLNNMNPQQRERTIARTEAMERLQPAQRQQVRSALGDLGALPEDRRRAVARTFRVLRDMPEPQRQAYLNSPQARAQFSDHERATLNNLITVSPYLPAPAQQTPQAPR